MDETWLYLYDPETKQQSIEWRHSSLPRPQKIPSAKIRWKSSRLGFLGSRRHTPHWLSSKGQTINAEYYSSLLVQLKDILNEKRRGKFTKGVLFLHDNAPVHRALATQKKLAYLSFQSWSPTLLSGSVPVGLPPVPWTEKKIESSPFSVRRGDHCCRGDPVGRATFWFFFSVLQMLEQRAKNCIELRGE